MINLSRWKIGVVAVAVLLGVLFTLPNFLPASVRDSIKFGPNKTLNLGLDLQGGSYLLVGVDTDALIKERTTNLTEDVRNTLNTQGVAFSGLGAAGHAVNVRITDPAQVDKAYGLLAAMATPLPKNPSLKDLSVKRGDDQTISMTLTEDGIRATSSNAVDTSIEIVRRRIDNLGTKEPSITRQGSTRIVVEAPGESDPEQLKRIIGQTAKLTFQMVDDTVTQADIVAGRIPPGSEALPDEEQAGAPLVVRKAVILSGSNLTKAMVGRDQYQRPAIDMNFDATGGQKFGQVTAENIGKRFAIILDGKAVSAPVIQGAIPGGHGQITGNFTPQQASDMVAVLNGGALPAPLKIEQQRTVTAELGADAVAKGEISTVIAFCSVIVFMLLAYGLLFGGISVASLVVNLLLLIGGMSMMQSTLTLPGIAGLILTLAMAVDANVLIYERMRDEVHAGRNLIAALNAGFSKALETIMDANVTTLVAAAIMYMFGAGPVKGFAVTLMLGTFTSVFSAVMVTQVLVALWYKWRRPKTLPIADDVAPKAWPLIKVLPKNTDIHFVNFSKFATIISVVAVAGSILMSTVSFENGVHPLKAPCGGLNCGVDFKGGTSLEITTPGSALDLGKLRASLNAQGLKDVQVQGVGDGSDAFLRFESPAVDPANKVEAVKAELQKIYPAAKFSNTEVVGAKVSSELLTGGILALFIAIGLMMIYIWFRFEWQFGLGAVFALFHDVILTFGLFAVFRLDFDLRAVAAILTIIGYSMNDTVVVFDRLRENLRKYKKMPLVDIINLSINETLSRTIITGLTAVMALSGLAFLGGEALFSFSISMIFGIIIGTYSSIYVAAPVILLWGVNRNTDDAEIIDMGGFKGGKKPKELP
ncbi:MAG TPA: protein translocase subunit SecD [Asticcacaulis sp.]|nr:protein translocase subunit SecD [Asticcacaulis sp.]